MVESPVHVDPPGLRRSFPAPPLSIFGMFSLRMRLAARRRPPLTAVKRGSPVVCLASMWYPFLGRPFCHDNAAMLLFLLWMRLPGFEAER